MGVGGGGDGESADVQLPAQPVQPLLQASGGNGELGASFIEQTG